MRSAIHDMANALSGIRGILELSDPDQPLSGRNRIRLESILTDGMTTLERARFLAMGNLPDALPEAGCDWRRKLTEQFEPLSIVFRCTVDLAYVGEPAFDRWPGELLRSYVLALSRQVLPYAQGAVLRIACGADAQGWRIQWHPAPGVPESLRAELTDRPRDISARWAIRIGASLGITLVAENGGLTAHIPRF